MRMSSFSCTVGQVTMTYERGMGTIYDATVEFTWNDWHGQKAYFVFVDDSYSNLDDNQRLAKLNQAGFELTENEFNTFSRFIWTNA